MRRAIFGVCLGLVVPSALLVVEACSTQATLAGAGGECFQATDCQPGLACLPQKSGQSICSNDFSMIQNELDGGVDGPGKIVRTDAPAADDGAPGSDAPPPPPVDGNLPDNAQPPPVDANMPDNAQPPVDANMPDDAGD